MRLALLTEFPGKLEPQFLHRLYEIHAPMLDSMRDVLTTTAAKLRRPRDEAAFPLGKISDRRATAKEQYVALIRRYVLSKEQFPAEITRMNLFVLCCDAMAPWLEELVDADWDLYASRKKSLLRYRLRLFFHSVLAPVIDMANFLLDFVLFFGHGIYSVCRWVFVKHEPSPGALFTSMGQNVWAYIRSNRWYFGVRLTVAITYVGVSVGHPNFSHLTPLAVLPVLCSLAYPLMSASICMACGSC